MKNSFLSLISIMALNGLAYAGGDMTTVIEPVVEIPEVKANPFYLGVGMGEAYVNDDVTDEKISATTLMLHAGYQYNDYLAFEGRYTSGLGGSDYDAGSLTGIGTGYDGDISSWGVYVKPMYPIGDVSLYALLGYGGIIIDDLMSGDAVENAFHWGLGVTYSFTKEVSVFADYVSLYNNTGFDYRATLDDIDADTWSVGFSYNF